MMRRNYLLPAAAGLALALVGGTASAMTLSVGHNTSGSSQNVSDSTSSNPLRYAAWGSSTLDSGGTTAEVVGNGVDARVRLTAVVAGDDDIVLGDTADLEAQVQLNATFTISAASFTTYNLTFDSSWLGAFVADNESGSADFVISNAVATVSGCAPGSLCNEGSQLTLTGQSQDGVTADLHNPFSDTGTYTIFGLTGNQTISVSYVIADMNIVAGLMDVAILLGQTSSICAADPEASCYPGAHGRTQANDGLFLEATTTITAIPEPGTMLLIGSGLLGLGVFGRRRD